MPLNDIRVADNLFEEVAEDDPRLKYHDADPTTDIPCLLGDVTLDTTSEIRPDLSVDLGSGKPRRMAKVTRRELYPLHRNTAAKEDAEEELVVVDDDVLPDITSV